MRSMFALGALALLVSASTAAQAETGKLDDGVSALKSMKACRSLPTKEARADCYDAALDGLTRAEAEGKVVVIDQEKLQTVRRQAFGFNLPSLGTLAHGLKSEPIKAVTLTISSARQDASDLWLIETSEQATWRQTQSSGYALEVKPGSTLTVTPGALGGYFCKVDRWVEFRCRRDR